ncbi:glycosyltransferase family 2 protein [Saccharolobus islandicus]|uniref:glycosyltransferase family 2 protein n=1 Tax=Saccharolobus islandicus TaxID=43080 RepID=UPI0003610947|nr:glycosyltransferase [Sulfolobus islandicus]
MIHSDIVISTVILNWNRSDLLRITVESYLKTIDVPYELTIVDNGSTDDSRKVLKELKDKYGDKINNIIFLDKNIGGEAINLGLNNAKGKLLHISENDIEYLPSWSSKVVKLFQIFNELGQLSLFAPAPTDEEVWVFHPIRRVLYKEGEILYEALGNVGTTSVIRREIWDKGVRVHTIKTDEFLFPDDVRLSEDIIRQGYIVAWAPYYLVRNLGHSYNEILRRIEYYKKNYDSKKGLGYQGLLSRIEYYNKKLNHKEKVY